MNEQKIRIFLSYARDDDAPEYWDASKSFMRRLYDDLSKQFDVWWDRECLPSRDLSFSKEIQDAIAPRDRVILVVGPHALQSDYVRGEWQYAQRTGICINPVLKEGEFEDVPTELRHVDIPDFRQSTVPYATALEQLIRQLNDPVSLPGTLHSLPAKPNQYVLLQERFDPIREALLADLKEPNAASKVVIFGIGGIGKSALATVLAHDPAVRREYPGGVFWLEVGEQPDILQLLYGIIQVFEPNISIQFPSVQSAKLHLSKLLEQRNCLFVLDNVWDFAVVESFDALNQASRTLITTRNIDWPKSDNMSFHRVDLLEGEQAKKLFACYADEDVPSEAEVILNYCAGLPLALAITGAMRRGGHTYEEIIIYLDNVDTVFEEHGIQYSGNKNVFRTLYASIDALQHRNDTDGVDIHDLYLNFAIFPKSQAIPVSTVLRFWEQLGIPGLHSRQMVRLLSERSLLTNLDEGVGRVLDTDRIVLHDLLYDCVRALTGDTMVGRHEQFLQTYQQENDPADWLSVIDQIDDDYLIAHLIYHLKAVGRKEDVHALLSSEHWSKRRNRQGLIKDLQHARSLLTEQDGIERHIRSIAFSDVLRKSFAEFPVSALPVALEQGWTDHNRLFDDLAGMYGSAKERLSKYMEMAPILSLGHRERFADGVLVWAEQCDPEIILQLVPYLPHAKHLEAYRIAWQKAFKLDFSQCQPILSKILEKLSEKQLGLRQFKTDIFEIEDFYRRVNIFGLLREYDSNAQDEIDQIWKRYIENIETYLNRYNTYIFAEQLAFLTRFVSSNIKPDFAIWRVLQTLPWVGDADFFDDIFIPLIPFVPSENLLDLYNKIPEGNNPQFYPACIATFYPNQQLAKEFQFPASTEMRGRRGILDLINARNRHGVDQKQTFLQAWKDATQYYDWSNFTRNQGTLWQRVVANIPLYLVFDAWQATINVASETEWSYGIGSGVWYALDALSSRLSLDKIEKACVALFTPEMMRGSNGSRVIDLQKALATSLENQQDSEKLWNSLFRYWLASAQYGQHSFWPTIEFIERSPEQLRGKFIQVVENTIRNPDFPESASLYLRLCSLDADRWLLAFEGIISQDFGEMEATQIEDSASNFYWYIRNKPQHITREQSLKLKNINWNLTLVNSFTRWFSQDDLRFEIDDIIFLIQHAPDIFSALVDCIDEHNVNLAHEGSLAFLLALFPHFSPERQKAAFGLLTKLHKLCNSTDLVVKNEWKYAGVEAILKTWTEDLVWQVWLYMFSFDPQSGDEYWAGITANVLVPFLGKDYLMEAWNQALSFIYPTLNISLGREICEHLISYIDYNHLLGIWKQIEQIEAEKPGWRHADRFKSAIAPHLSADALMRIAQYPEPADTNLFTCSANRFRQYIANQDISTGLVSELVEIHARSKASAEQKIKEATSIDELILCRPYLQRIGGKHLREVTKQICDDAQGWWKDAIKLELNSTLESRHQTE